MVLCRISIPTPGYRQKKHVFPWDRGRWCAYVYHNNIIYSSFVNIVVYLCRSTNFRLVFRLTTGSTIRFFHIVLSFAPIYIKRPRIIYFHYTYAYIMCYIIFSLTFSKKRIFISDKRGFPIKMKIFGGIWTLIFIKKFLLENNLIFPKKIKKITRNFNSVKSDTILMMHRWGVGIVLSNEIDGNYYKNEK